MHHIRRQQRLASGVVNDIRPSTPLAFGRRDGSHPVLRPAACGICAAGHPRRPGPGRENLGNLRPARAGGNPVSRSGLTIALPRPPPAKLNEWEER